MVVKGFKIVKIVHQHFIDKMSARNDQVCIMALRQDKNTILQEKKFPNQLEYYLQMFLKITVKVYATALFR